MPEMSWEIPEMFPVLEILKIWSVGRLPRMKNELPMWFSEKFVTDFDFHKA